ARGEGGDAVEDQCPLSKYWHRHRGQCESRQWLRQSAYQPRAWQRPIPVPDFDSLLPYKTSPLYLLRCLHFDQLKMVLLVDWQSVPDFIQVYPVSVVSA